VIADGAVRVMKRALDVGGALVLGVLTAPVMVAIAVAIRLASPGPALFRQERVGEGGRPFALLKFRTMVVGAEAMTAELMGRSRDPDWLLIDRDPRVFAVGRFLRLTSIDELPQLWNVLRGEMSLVGPRPLTPCDDRRVPEWARARSKAKPGLTGPWQVAGRTDVPFDEMVELDCLYVASSWSLRRDLGLIARTVPAVLLQRGSN
jgi:lipopolysaccharide/colanic/teichoic acid biosynthesis glycosyltransferase